MLLKDFFLKFPDEDSCISYFKDIRQSVGLTCSKCGSTDFTWMSSSRWFRCNRCGYSLPLFKGTAMEKSHIPLYDWFFTAHMMTSIKQVLSAKEIQYQLEMKSYPPVWLMMMKYRDIMGKRDAQYKLSDQVELDISYFPTYDLVPSEQGTTYDREEKKTRVLVIAESKAIDDILEEYLLDAVDNENVNKASKLYRKSLKQNVKKVVHYIKMFAVPNGQHETIRPYIAEALEESTKVVTDGGSNLKRLRDIFDHEPHLETEGDKHEIVKRVFPWVHIITGECRSAIDAIHKEVDERFLQLYLNEYCWKFNRRYFRDSKDPKYDLFYRLIKIAAMYTSDIKWRDYGKIN